VIPIVAMFQAKGMIKIIALVAVIGGFYLGWTVYNRFAGTGMSLFGDQALISGFKDLFHMDERGGVAAIGLLVAALMAGLTRQWWGNISAIGAFMGVIFLANALNAVL
jgi:hypothetical protein